MQIERGILQIVLCMLVGFFSPSIWAEPTNLSLTCEYPKGWFYIGHVFEVRFSANSCQVNQPKKMRLPQQECLSIQDQFEVLKQYPQNSLRPPKPSQVLKILSKSETGTRSAYVPISPSDKTESGELQSACAAMVKSVKKALP